MCGRYFLDTLPELLAGQFRVHKYPVYDASYNIAPTQPSLILRRHNDDNEWAWVRWGLVPHWAKDVSIGARMINARGETVAEKPAFRGAFRYRRCIVPASGFYEWRTQAGTKQPFAIVPTDAACFGFAGLWEHWTAPDGSVLETSSVLTTTPNALMATIHDRMPVILDPGRLSVLDAGHHDRSHRADPVIPGRAHARLCGRQGGRQCAQQLGSADCADGVDRIAGGFPPNLRSGNALNVGADFVGVDPAGSGFTPRKLSRSKSAPTNSQGELVVRDPPSPSRDLTLVTSHS